MNRYLFSLILMSYLSPSFAMESALDEPLDKPLVHTKVTPSAIRVQTSLPINNPEDFRVQNPHYLGYSNLIFMGIHPWQNPMYPKTSIVLPRHSNRIANVALYAPLEKAQIPQLFEDILSLQFPNHKRVISFIVQSLEKGVDNDPQALQVQFFAHSPFVDFSASSPYCNKNLETSLSWTVIPGVLGNVEPLEGSVQSVGLLSAKIETRAWLPTCKMLSPDNMFLKGFDDETSKDTCSLVIFTDVQGNNIAEINYRWVLDHKDMCHFENTKSTAHSFHGLIHALGDSSNAFKEKNLVEELKRYEGLLPRLEGKSVILLENVGEFISQPHIIESYYYYKNHLPSDEAIVEFLLKNQGYKWTEFSDSNKKWIINQFILENDLRNIVKQKDIIQGYLYYQHHNTFSSDEELVKFLLENQGYKWEMLSVANRNLIIARFQALNK